MAIIFKNKKEYTKYALIVHPDKARNLSEVEKKIATDIFIGINNARDNATKIADANNEKYPFEYIPKKDEYCFLISQGYPNKDVIDEEVINTNLQDMYKNKCNELQKQNFNFEDQVLVVKHLKDTPEEKRNDVLKSHIILNNPKGHSDSELDYASLCIEGILDECRE